MIDQLINRIKDAYFDLDRDTARGQRFFAQSQAFTPGAIQPSPSQMQSAGQFPPNTPLGAQPQQDVPNPGQGVPQPAPEPSMLDLIGARR